MSAPCAEPIAWGHLVDYWAGDLAGAESDRVEEHLFACEACTAESERVARVAQAFHTAVPAVVGADQVRELRARGLVVEENSVAPGTRREAVFQPGVDILIHRLHGLDLALAERVHLSVRVESTGDVLFEDHFAPFDRARGEVLVACQRHFSSFPPDVVFDVRAHNPSGGVALTTFTVPHVFSGAGSP
jgi:hypothetical protein